MKIVCDCGQEMKFKVDETVEDCEEETNAKQDRSKMDIESQHDESWITCKKCGKIIHFFC